MRAVGHLKEVNRMPVMDSSYFFVFLSFGVFLVGLWLSYLTTRKEPDPIRKIIRFFQVSQPLLTLYLAWLGFFAADNIGAFSSFGKPISTTQLQRPEQVLVYLQDYNARITRISLVIFILILSTIVLLFIFQIISGTLQKAILTRNCQGEERNRNNGLVFENQEPEIAGIKK